MSNMKVDRRTVIKAAAWSIPVVSLAVASPAYAASSSADKAAPVSGDAVLTFNGEPRTQIESHYAVDAWPEPYRQYATAFAAYVNVQNKWMASQTTVQPLTITLTFPLSHVKAQAPSSIHQSLTLLGSPSVIGDRVSFSFMYSALTTSASTGELKIIFEAQDHVLTSSPMVVATVVNAPQAVEPLSQASRSQTWGSW